MLVSISEAAKLAGVSRTTLYKKYIAQGKLTVLKNAKNLPEIDTSELLRVFGVLQQQLCNFQKFEHGLTLPVNDENVSKIEQLENELKHSQELVQEKDKHIADLQKALHLIEYTQKTQVVQPVQETKGQEPTVEKVKVSLIKKEQTKTNKKSLATRFRMWLTS